MNAIKINQDKITLEISRGELQVLSNALNEVCNSIEVWEFETRMGIYLEDARAMLESLISIYKKADQTLPDHIKN